MRELEGANKLPGSQAIGKWYAFQDTVLHNKNANERCLILHDFVFVVASGYLAWKRADLTRTGNMLSIIIDALDQVNNSAFKLS